MQGPCVTVVVGSHPSPPLDNSSTVRERFAKEVFMYNTTQLTLPFLMLAMSVHTGLINLESAIAASKWST